jgi:hypothetical protein
MSNSLGHDGDKVEYRLDFREFSRVQLGTKWYKISDFYLWRAHLRFKKVGGRWQNDVSILALDNEGF